MVINHQSILDHISGKVKELLSEAEAGHDWLHIERVWHNALLIIETEPNANSLIVQLATLLHDIADAKFNGGDETLGPFLANKIMDETDLLPDVKNEVILIIENMSYKGGFYLTSYNSLELDIVKDADRLDAIGAIGIARTFTYGGFKNRRLYDKTILPQVFETREAYKNSFGPTLNHFFEKLLKLKDSMTTQKGKLMATERHEVMVHYLRHFFEEVGLDKNILQKNVI